MDTTLEVIRVAWPIVAAIVGAFAGFARMMLSGYEKHVDRRFGTIEKMLESESGEAQKVRLELQDYKLYVSQHYVDRDQWVRVEAGRDITLRQMNKELRTISTELARYSNAKA